MCSLGTGFPSATRWHIREGNVIFPKSTSPAHIADNMDIFDFELSDD